jgi:hypothetical protein
MLAIVNYPTLDEMLAYEDLPGYAAKSHLQDQSNDAYYHGDPDYRSDDRTQDENGNEHGNSDRCNQDANKDELQTTERAEVPSSRLSSERGICNDDFESTLHSTNYSARRDSATSLKMVSSQPSNAI